MNYQWVVPLLAAIANLVLGIVVYRNGRSSPVREVFCFLTVMLVFWNLYAFVLFFVTDMALAFSLARVLRSASLMMAPALSHLALSLKERPPRYSRAVLIIDYAIAVALIVANNFDLLVAGIDLNVDAYHVPTGGFHSVPAPLYDVFTVLLLANVGLAGGYLTHEYVTGTSPQRRQQLRFWLVGAAIALPIGLTNLLPAYHVPIYPLGSLGNVVWAGVVAYAIVRHRLMDIDLAVTRGVAYGAVSLILILPAWALTLWMQRLSFGEIHRDFSSAVLVMLVAVGVLFPTLRLRAQSRIAQSFFREKHEYRAALSGFTRSIVRILDREKLIHELVSTLSDTLRLERIAIALAGDGWNTLTVRYAVGVPPTTTEFLETDDLVVSLARRQKAVVRDELEISDDPRERALAAGVCQRNGWEVLIPLTAGGKLTGFISLGRKRKLEAFSAEDLDLLEMLGAEASVALENARLYEELKKSQDIIRRADRLSALGTLAAGIAHEVRNPLVAIQTFFQLAPERLHDEEFFTTFLSMTAGEVTRISTLITELLSFARSPTHTLSPISLNDAVERVATLLDPEARKHHLTLTRTLEAALPLVLSDADQIKQVLINLVLNAIQATQPNGSVSVITRIVEHRNVIFGQVEVRDTGVGIPKDRLDHIFNPFFTTKDKGTGLGLAIAHQIITEHGGLITLESQEGHGTSFFIDLPACDQGLATAVLISDPPADTPAVHRDEPVAERYERPRKVAS